MRDVGGGGEGVEVVEGGGGGGDQGRWGVGLCLQQRWNVVDSGGVVCLMVLCGFVCFSILVVVGCLSFSCRLSNAGTHLSCL